MSFKDEARDIPDEFRKAAQPLRKDEARGNALGDVIAERNRQDAKWGEQNHDPFVYGAILMEEAGEFMQAALHLRFADPRDLAKKSGAVTPETLLADLHKEAIHVAAVALSIVECLKRKKWKFQSGANELDLLETAWGIIANANGGDWEKASPEWREAAARWRDQYHAKLKEAL